MASRVDRNAGSQNFPGVVVNTSGTQGVIRPIGSAKTVMNRVNAQVCQGNLGDYKVMFHETNQVLARVGRIVLTVGFLSSASVIHADVIHAPAYDAAASSAGLAGAGLGSGPTLREELFNQASTMAVVSSTVGNSPFFGLPGGSPFANNPYLLFADILAMASNGNQPAAATRVLSFDASNGLPTPGPVPLPASLWLLIAGLGAITVYGRKRGMALSWK